MLLRNARRVEHGWVVLDSSDLSPNDIRQIAGLAGGVHQQTVEDYLSGKRETQIHKRRAIERALHQLGWPHLVRARVA